ncbi:TIGR02587 family membrane protein [Truepera radiovictrix]|uniref:Integral membrane protein TIGR02587 n=1 Tax=Truepera radiovictrix (strain DSM 17093 / CIP 108686 / LMG 22925 / RQ-24) TaxID=649638 RepID=D7CTA3_TRURR|nr:TIGR02587 family membrane protein [Truepera radiovictrix]ADI15566.1 integral membrane protein TIGR02587 [Truepera radiovictrix DSM 17093]WMT58806.1 TIGR02587 family membrane protein [Truepera radiovictrix]
MDTLSLARTRESSRTFAVELARAFGGALIFSLPMLMTMEMWWLGFYLERFRLALLVGLNVPLLVLLSRYIGFRDSSCLLDDLLDTFVALAVGFVTAGAFLLLFSVLERGMSWDEVVGKVAMQVVPASIGAMLAARQLGIQETEKGARDRGYGAELVYMVVGALFLAFNLAPTDEMVLISYQFTPWHALLLVLASLVIMHAFVYAVAFRGQEAVPEATPVGSLFLRFTVVGYAVALLVSLYVLWVFGRAEGMGVAQLLMAAVVLGFPAAVGAAAARLIL